VSLLQRDTRKQKDAAHARINGRPEKGEFSTAPNAGYAKIAEKSERREIRKMGEYRFAVRLTVRFSVGRRYPLIAEFARSQHAIACHSHLLVFLRALCVARFD